MINELPYCNELINNDIAVKKSGLKKLKSHLEQLLSTGTREECKNLLKDISDWILINIHSQNLPDNFFSVDIINQLYIICDQSTITQWANYIKSLINKHNSEGDHDELLIASCNTYGELIKIIIMDNPDYVDQNVENTISKLKEPLDKRQRINSLCVLQTYIKNTPTVFIKHINSFLSNIDNPLKDNNVLYI